MSTHFAYLPLFVRDFETDPNVRMMRWIDQAIYLRMLMASWEAGPLPDDDNLILRLIGAQSLGQEIPALAGCADPLINFDVARAVRGVLEAVWERIGGAWINPRLEAERARAEEVRSGNSERTSRGWETRRSKHAPSGCSADAQHVNSNASQAQAQAQAQAQKQSTEPPLTTFGVGAEPAEPAAPPPAPRQPKARKTAQGPHHDAIRAWDELCVEHRGEPWAWASRDAVAVAHALKKAGSLDRFIDRARRLWDDPPDAWYAQNISPTTLNSKWNELGVRVLRPKKKTRDDINRESLARAIQEL